MASKSNYLSKELLDHVLKTGAYTVPTNIYVALATSAPDDDDDGSDFAAKECDYAGYDRVVCNGWDAASGTTTAATANTAAISFPECASGTADVVTHFAVLDGNAKTDADHVLYWGQLSAQKTIEVGDTPRFAAGDLDITED